MTCNRRGVQRPTMLDITYPLLYTSRHQVWFHRLYKPTSAYWPSAELLTSSTEKVCRVASRHLCLAASAAISHVQRMTKSGQWRPRVWRYRGTRVPRARLVPRAVSSPTELAETLEELRNSTLETVLEHERVWRDRAVLSSTLKRDVASSCGSQDKLHLALKTAQNGK